MNVKIIGIILAVILVIAALAGGAIYVAPGVIRSFDGKTYMDVTFPATVRSEPNLLTGNVEWTLWIDDEYTLEDSAFINPESSEPTQEGAEGWFEGWFSSEAVVQATLKYGTSKVHHCSVDVGGFSTTKAQEKDIDLTFKNVELLDIYVYRTDAMYTLSAKLIINENTIINKEFLKVSLLDESNTPDVNPDDNAPKICLSPTYTTLEYTGEDATNSYTVGQLLSHYNVEWEIITEVLGNVYGDTTYNPDLGMPDGIVFPIEKGDRIEISVTAAGCFHINDFKKV